MSPQRLAWRQVNSVGANSCGKKHIAMMKHAHHTINLANEMSIFLKTINKDGAVSSVM